MGKTFSAIYNETARKVGDTTAGFITSDVIPTINDVGRNIYQSMNYKFKERTADITLVGSTQSYLMSTIASTWDEDTPVNIFYRDSANKRQPLECYDDKEWDLEEDTDEGDVYGFHISKISAVWRVYFTLVPNSAFVSSYSPLKMEYFTKWTSLVETTDDAVEPDIPDGNRQLLIYRSCEILCGQMGDTESAIFWKSKGDKEEGLLKKKQVHRVGRPKKVRPIPSTTVRGRSHIIKDYNG